MKARFTASSIAVTACIFFALGYGLHYTQVIQARQHEIIALRDKLIHDTALGELSNDCLTLLKEHPRLVLRRNMGDNTGWLKVPQRILLLNPYSIEVGKYGVDIIVSNRTFVKFSIHCDYTGHLTFGGDVDKSGYAYVPKEYEDNDN